MMDWRVLVSGQGVHVYADHVFDESEIEQALMRCVIRRLQKRMRKLHIKVHVRPVLHDAPFSPCRGQSLQA